MKLRVNIPRVLEADVEKGSRLLSVINGYITWCVINRKNKVVTINTCNIHDFDSQINISRLYLNFDELKKLASMIKKFK